MSTTGPISDPVAAKKPSKDYPWWIENIEHRITQEVSVELIAFIVPALLHIILTYSWTYRCDSFSKHIAIFLLKMFPITYILW
jgi:hypothetical protein